MTLHPKQLPQRKRTASGAGTNDNDSNEISVLLLLRAFHPDLGIASAEWKIRWITVSEVNKSKVKRLSIQNSTEKSNNNFQTVSVWRYGRRRENKWNEMKFLPCLAAVLLGELCAGRLRMWRQMKWETHDTRRQTYPHTEDISTKLSLHNQNAQSPSTYHTHTHTHTRQSSRTEYIRKNCSIFISHLLVWWRAGLDIYKRKIKRDVKIQVKLF